jgi:hypothetical protein
MGECQKGVYATMHNTKGKGMFGVMAHSDFGGCTINKKREGVVIFIPKEQIIHTGKHIGRIKRKIAAVLNELTEENLKILNQNNVIVQVKADLKNNLSGGERA